MSKWIAKLFEMKTNRSDIVRFIRTEYYKDTKHLKDEDCLAFYQHITHKRRI